MPRRPKTDDQLSLQAQARSRAVKSGNSFEKDLDTFHHQRYHPSGYAKIERHHMATAPMMGRTKKGKPALLRRIIGAAPFDFSGTLGWASPFPGRSVIIEAKARSARAVSLPIGEDSYGIRPEQLRVLADSSVTFRAVVALLWRNEDTIGILFAKKIVAALGAFEAGHINRIGRERFFWLQPGELDYLPTVLEHEHPAQIAR